MTLGLAVHPLISFMQMTCLMVLCTIYDTYGMEEAILWSDSLDSDNQDQTWILYGSVNRAIRSPLNPNEFCWSIIRTNTVPNPYMYRVTDLSSAIMSTPEPRVTIHYNLIPWDLQLNMQCLVSYSIIPLVGTPNIEWIPIAQYNSTQNALNLSSQSYRIPIHHIEVNIAIKFMLYNTPNNRANNMDHSQHSACYLSTIRLAVETERFDANSIATPQIEEHDAKLISGHLNLDIVLIVSVAVLCIVLCAIVTVTVLSWYYKDTSRQKPVEATKKNGRKHRHSTITARKTPSFHLGRVDPTADQLSPTSWTGATAHLAPKVHRRSIYATTTATPDREPSFESEQTSTTIVLMPDRLSYQSKGLSQVITKSANFYRYDTESISPTKNMNEVTPRRKIIIGDFESRKATMDTGSDKNTDVMVARWQEWEDEQKAAVLETDSFGETLRNVNFTSITQTNTTVFASPPSGEFESTQKTNVSMRVEPPTMTKTYGSMYTERDSSAITPKEPS